jgi:hypothetical protein
MLELRMDQKIGTRMESRRPARPRSSYPSSRLRHRRTTASQAKSVPTVEINQKELDSDLAFAKAFYLTHLQYRSGKHQRNDRRTKEKAIKRAKLLRQCFSDESVWSNLPPDTEFPTDYLQKLIPWIEKHLVPRNASQLDVDLGRCYADSIGIGRLSAAEWLLGEHLPRIYETHFQQRATAALDSPYVCFALGALLKLGITRPDNGQPFAPETVVRALTLVRNGQPRRVGKAD